MSENLPLTYDRIKNLLTEAEIRYTTDDDGEIRMIYEGDKNINGDIIVIVSIKGKGILRVYGFGRNELSGQKKAEALLVCNQWNAEKLFPKSYYEERALKAICEHSVDFEGGVVRETLRDNVLPAIIEIGKFHEYLSGKL